MRSATRLHPVATASLLAGLLHLAACVTDPLTGRQTLNLYSLDQDVALGRSTLEANTRQLRDAGVAVDQDTPRLQQLQRITRRIAAVSDFPDLPYTVTLYHTNIVNAAAAPGGALFVFEGLYHPDTGLARTEDELAAVLAHEIAHVNARHSTERLSRMWLALGLAEGVAALATHHERDDLARVLRTAFTVGTALYIPYHSRMDEREADRIGLQYMARAGYDPRAAIALWDRVAAGTGGQHPAGIFATHPGAAERSRLLRQALPGALELYRRSH